MSVCVGSRPINHDMIIVNQNIDSHYKQFQDKKKQPQDDKVFKVPFPRRPTTILNNQSNNRQQNSIQIKLEHLEQQRIQAFRNAQIQALKEKYEKLRTLELIRKRNRDMLVYRMKVYAQLPEYKDAKFHIPVDLNLYGYQLFTLNQIDTFIVVNKLIRKEVNQRIDDQISVRNCDVPLSQDLVGKSQQPLKLIKSVTFKVPEQYLNELEGKQTEDFSNSDVSTNNSSDEEEEELAQNFKSNPIKIGAYSIDVRSKKILKYKNKIYKRRAIKPVSKIYKGRSQIANNKLRINGRFVKQSI